MVNFFFYKKLTDIKLISNINSEFEIDEGTILVQKYDTENNILEISNNIEDNTFLLHGKIVTFNMKFEDVIKKINEMKEIINENNQQLFNLKKLIVNNKETYIIY
jgi:hypothetical protein